MFVHYSSSIDFVPVVQSAPKKYLVETEDGGVEDTELGPEFEKDAKKLNKLNEKALSEGLSEKQEDEAKEILDNNGELAELVVEYGSKPQSENKFWGFLGGLAKKALPVLGGLAKAVAPVILDFAKGALGNLLAGQGGGGGGGGALPPPPGGGGGGDEEYYGYEPENRNFDNYGLLKNMDSGYNWGASQARKGLTQNRQRLGYRDPTQAPRNTPPPYVRTQRPWRANSKIRILG